MTARSRLPRRALVARIVIVVLVVWLGATGVLIVLARQRASRGLDALQQAKSHLTAETLLQGKGLVALEQAASDFSSAHSLAANPVLAPWPLVPIAGNNVTEVRDLTAAAEQVSQVGARAARDGAVVLRQHPSTGAERLALLNQVAAIAGRAHAALANLDLGPSSLLVGPVADARNQFVDRLNKLRTATADAQALAQGAVRLLTGPSRYLVLAANNGEMRAGSGMFLAAGVATFANGTFTMGPMVPTPTIDVPAGAVPLPPALVLWSFAQPNQSWRDLATTPRFDVTAPLAAQMWHAVTGQSVDGVLAVDPLALQALLAAQGPVQAGGQTLSADNVVSFLLLDQYDGVPADVGDQQVRLDQLSTVASATVDALSGRPWQPARLISKLSDVGKGRHVLAWAADLVQERAWAAAGISGRLRSTSLAVSIENFGGNKLDQFLNVDATLTIRRLPNGGAHAHVDLALHNVAPDGLPGYVAGPNPATTLSAGEYQGIVAVNVPRAASAPQLGGVGPPLLSGYDGPTKSTASGYQQIPQGHTLHVTLDFQAPPGLTSLEIEPSARIPPITWHYRNTTSDDSSVQHFSW